MKKNRAVVVLLLTAIVTVFLCYTATVGIGPTGTGSMKNINTGLDLAGGVSITYQAVGDTPSSEDMSDTVYKMQRRVEQYSTEATAYQEGTDRITVEIPGATDADEILSELGQPGSLCFIEQTDDDGNYNFESDGTGYVLSRTLDEIREAGSVVLEGSDVADAQGGAYQTSQNSSREYAVQLTLTSEGKEKFATATEENVGNQIAIVYDNEILSAPNVEEAITGGEAQITGMSDVEEAQNLASYIRIGSLSIELEELRSSVVAAQLGEEAITTSLTAGAIGLVLVILLMTLVYRVPGMVAGLALILYTAMELIILNAFDITLTLPGIAGIILGIGMAVDANVIIYARIQEEITAGASVKMAIKSGFSKAFSAIFDGNVTTLIAAFVLMWLGSGTVKGFAYTLAMGIVVSMFTALVISRFVINALYAVGIQNAKWYGKARVFKKFDFVGKKKVFFLIAVLVILSGPVVMVINSAAGNGAMNFGLDFSGGTATTVTFNEDMDIKQIDSEVTPLVEEVTGDSNVQPTKVVGTNQVVIKTRTLSQEERAELNDVLEENFDVDTSLTTTESISGTVSAEMRQDAIVAVIVAVLCMLVYIWFRFRDICFASSAVLALCHDVLVVLAFYTISRISVGNTFIACMLTIVGYSINATIVIFDRIRENIRSDRNREHLPQIVNDSIIQTLTRSIYTSLTTFLTIAVLYILGVSSIREFAAPLMVGVICGAYSSVFVTGSLWLVLKGHFKKAEQPAIADEGAAGSSTGKNAPVQQKASGKKNGGKQQAPQQNANQPKKKNRKRVAERMAREEAEKQNKEQ